MAFEKIRIKFDLSNDSHKPTIVVRAGEQGILSYRVTILDNGRPTIIDDMQPLTFNVLNDIGEWVDTDQGFSEVNSSTGSFTFTFPSVVYSTLGWQQCYFKLWTSDGNECMVYADLDVLEGLEEGIEPVYPRQAIFQHFVDRLQALYDGFVYQTETLVEPIEPQEGVFWGEIQGDITNQTDLEEALENVNGGNF